MITNSENLLKVLSGTNPWWRNGKLPDGITKPVRRFAYFEGMKILQHPDIRRMVLLTGARRIGKTTIMHQMIESLIEQGIRPERIAYISFDHPLLKLCRFDAILDVYKQNVYPGDDIYYFFDEIQYADDWDTWLKTLYDTNLKCRAVATGSASPVLAVKASESGVGRWSILSIPTLSFYEYCTLCKGLLDIEAPELAPDIKPSSLRGLSRQEQRMTFQKLSPLLRHFNRYLAVGGFPELALSKDEYYAQRIMREDVVDKVLKRDIPALYNIRSVADLEKIFLYLCYNSSSIISMDAVSRELNGVSRPTVEKYIQYLESANLIYISNPIDIRGKKILKSQPKIYIADAAIRNAVIMQEDLFTNPTEMGIMVETAVYKHVRAFYYRLAANVGYYRKNGKDSEIDVVVDYPEGNLGSFEPRRRIPEGNLGSYEPRRRIPEGSPSPAAPRRRIPEGNLGSYEPRRRIPGGRILVEVKYREQYSLGEKASIISEADKSASTLLITKKEDDFGPLQINPAVYRIPAYAFMYLLGHAEKNSYANWG